MSDTHEAGSGFDRRSLIKKGLAAGGIVAAAPMISTFNAPAFAASAGTYRIRFAATQSLLGAAFNATRMAPGATACEIQAAWSSAADDPGAAEIPINVTGGLLEPAVFSLAGDAATSCTIVAARTDNPGGLLFTANCNQPVSSTSISVTFPQPFLDGSWNVFLIVSCT